MTKLQKAQDALKKAEAAALDNVNKESNTNSANASKDSADKMKAEEMITKENNETLKGDAGDSERKLVMVERKYGEAKHQIFASTVINKKGKPVLEDFLVPVNVEVSLPVEIIAHIKQRGIAKQAESGLQTIVPEFVITYL